MAKICILGDTHIGVRGSLPLFHQHFRVFFNDVLLPYLLENNITTILQLGDLFDVRKNMNFYSLFESKDYLFDQLEKHNIRFVTLVGNHDSFWRESIEVNSSSLVLAEYKNVEVYSNPTTIKIEDTSFDIIPWICKENIDDIQNFIKQSRSDICLGHFEIAGFAMYKGVESHGGLSKSMFEKYEQVWSGHYHTRSKQENITYVGTPYEMTWQDHDDPKGFHTFDLETRELSFIENPNNIFTKIEYNEDNVPEIESLRLKDKFVKIIVVNKKDLYKFDLFVNTVQNNGCYDLKIVEDLSEYKESSVDEDVNLEDTLSVLSNYIDKLESDSNKDQIKLYMKSLYLQAINLESL